MLSTRTRSAVSFNKGLNNRLMRRVFQNLIANAIKHTPLHLLVEKIIEENTRISAPKLASNWSAAILTYGPLVEAIRTLAPDVPVTFSSFAFLRSRSGHKRC